MSSDFYPFVENGNQESSETVVRHPARIAVYDDAAAAPRVVVVEPKDVRAYLEEITLQVTQLAQGQGGAIPFMVIREIVENFIHAYFMEPTISILDHGNTIRFSDQGPGIREKDRALQYGTTSATEEMRRYIRGVGSGLPYAQQYMIDKGGSLQIDDNIAGGTIVTISIGGTEEMVEPEEAPEVVAAAPAPLEVPQGVWGQAPGTWAQPAATQQWYASPYGQPWQPAWPQQGAAAQAWPQQPMPAQPSLQPQVAQPYAVQAPQSPQAGWPQPQTAAPALSARAQKIMDYLVAHDAVGPSDLARSFGESQPTWTRELQSLEEMGLIRKSGQKRVLTAMGRSLLGGAR